MIPTSKAKGKGGLRPGESLAAGMRRLARRHLDAACRHLDQNPDTRKAVHEARKSLKKLRALLRLLAPELGRECYRREMRAFRDAGRLLAPLRDAEVRLHTLDALMERSGLAAKDFKTIRSGLEADALGLSRQAAEPRRRVCKRLELARRRVRDWPLGALKEKSLAGEIRRTYRKGRKALRLARREEADVPAFHAWRKRVKELWYHLRIAHVFLHQTAGTRIAEIEAIGELAGEVNDGAVLRATLAAQPASPQAARLIAEIDARLPALQQAALERGDRFYAEKPRDLVRRYF